MQRGDGRLKRRSVYSVIVPGRAVVAQGAVKQLFSSFRGLKAQGLSRHQTLRRDRVLDCRH